MAAMAGQAWSLLLLACLVTMATGRLASQTCDASRRRAVIQGNAEAMLVGLINMHNSGTGGVGCGDPSSNMQAYESIRWILELINKKDEDLRGVRLTDYYVPGIRIGMMVYDYCDSKNVAVNSMGEAYPQLFTDIATCMANATSPMLLGVVGPSSSEEAVEVAKFAGKFDIPVVSFSATASSLTRSSLYPNFLRTVSPDGPLMDAIVQTLLRLQWSYVAVVYTDNTYGRSAYEELRPRLAAAGVCLTVAVVTSPTDTSATTMDSIYSQLLGTNTTGVIYLGNEPVANAILGSGEGVMERGQLQWIFTDSISLLKNWGTATYQNGILVILSTSRAMVEFEDYWVRINETIPRGENPWFQEWFTKENRCSLPGYPNPLYPNLCLPTAEVQKRNFIQDRFAEPAVHAIFTYARALRDAQRALCGSVPGMCDALKNLSSAQFLNNYVKKVNIVYGTEERVSSLASKVYEPYKDFARVSFDSFGDINTPAYDVWSYNDIPATNSTGFRFLRAGYFANSRMTLTTDNIRMYSTDRRTPLGSLPASPCPQTGCSPCLGMPPTTPYWYRHGQIVLTGIFTLHDKGTAPNSCGAIGSDLMRQQMFEAMIHGLNQVANNLNPNLSPPLLGGLAFDDCGSSVRSQNFISRVQQGQLQITDGSGNTLDPRRVDAYTAASSSPLTIPLAEVMNVLQRPLLGYASRSSVLSDRTRYPYYLRVHPSMEQELRAIIMLLQRFGWYYVQVVHANTEEYSLAASEFKRLAAEEGICVVATHSIMAMSGGAMVVGKLRMKSLVKTVVVLGEKEHARQLLSGITERSAFRSFYLIGSSGWGDSQYVLRGNELAAEGAVTIKWQSSPLTQFRNYLSGLTPSTHSTFVFMEWYQAQLNCYLGNSNPQGYSRPCTNLTSSSMTMDSNFMLNYHAIDVINAVYAVANGLRAMLQNLCGSATVVCPAYLSNPNRGSVLLDYIRNASFAVEDTSNTFRFSGYEASVPFEVNNILLNYTSVGTVSPLTRTMTLSNVYLTREQTPVSTYSPTCPTVCVECLYMMRGLKYWYIPGDLVIPGIFDLHYSGSSPLSCGAVKTSNGLQYLEAFNFALDYVNRGAAGFRLNNVTLGGLAMDGCSSTSRATTLVNLLQSGALVLQNSAGQDIHSQDFLSWMSYDSQSTIDMADILATMGIPIVTPAATAPLLLNKNRFSTFFRTVPSDSIIAEAMAEFLKQQSKSYVLSLNAPETGSRGGLDAFKGAAKTRGICVLASYEFETDGTIQQIVDAIVASTTKVVVVFAEPDRFIQDLVADLKNRYPTETVVFVANREWDATTSYADKSFMFTLRETVDIAAFRSYMAGRIPALVDSNPWLREYYQARMGCNLPGQTGNFPACTSPPTPLTSRSNWRQDLFVLSTINAVMAVAFGVRDTLIEKCGSTAGVCSKFKYDADTYPRVMQNMDIATFTDLANETFYFIQREAHRVFNIKMFDQQVSRVIGDYDNATLRLQDAGITITAVSDCDEKCLACQDSSSNFQDFSYIPGNIYLVGLFDVHNAGATPYTCGEINTKHGLPLMEAFNFALEYVNNRRGMFSTLRNDVLPLGGIALDVCKSPTRAANLVANIHSRNINLQANGRTISPDFLDVYIGTLTTDSTLTVADVLDSLSIPQISYGATSLELRDSRRYRYFLRTVPADDKQARALISYLKRFDIDNVQVISSFESVGEKGKEEFLRLAYLNRICVSQNITVGMNGPVTVNEANLVMGKLLNNTRAKVVVLFLDNPRPILEAVERTSAVHQNFFFLGTDKWGADPDYLQGLREVLVGPQNQQRAATLDIETADLPEFDEYLEEKTPLNYFRNPWFQEYYEKVFECTINDVPGQTRCASSLRGLPRSSKYIQDPYVLYVVNAVFSAAMGINRTITNLCGENVISCNIFRTSGERRQLIWQGIKKTNFTDATKQPFYFTPGGESDRGYHIYEPIRNPSGPGFVYKNVGSYNDTHYLKLDIRYDIPIDSVCTNANCPCNFPVYRPSRYMVIPSPYDLNLVYVGDIHKRHSSGDPFMCGPIDTQRDFQNMLAFFYAIGLVNQNEGLSFGSSLKLGGVALDTCSQPLGIGRDFYSLLSGESVCNAHQPGQVIPPSTAVAFIADRSSNAIPVSSILSPLGVTSMSQSATSVALSNKLRHGYFLRTVPPDNIQVMVMLEVMRTFGWSYVSLVYSDDAYGIAARDTLLGQVASQSNSSCVSRALKMDIGASLSDAERIVEQLGQQAGARVVILFVTPDQARLLLQAVKNKGLARRFLWLASDAWGSSMAIVNGYEEEASGAITIQIRSDVVTNFTEWMTGLTLTNRRGIPDDWFEEFYQHIHSCRLLTSNVRQEYPSICTGQEQITPAMVPQDPFVLHTIISVYLVAQGLTNIQECRSSDNLASCLSLLANRRERIFQGIQSASWNVPSGMISNGTFRFAFTSAGYGDIGYNILNFHRSQERDAYIYSPIGTYKTSLSLDPTRYRGLTAVDVSTVPLSQCAVASECICVNQDLTSRLYSGGAVVTASRQASRTELKQGTDGLFYYALTGEKADVQTSPDAAARYSDIWGVIVAAIAAMGVFVSLALFLYLLVTYPIRGGTSVLGYMLSFGIILLYGLVFAFIFHANEQICAIRRFCLGFCYAICYAALFVKLIDCWRSKKTDVVKYSKLGTPLGLFFVAVMLVLVQVIINTEWLILVPPRTYLELYNGVAWPLCHPAGFYDEALVLSVVYVMVLIALCVVFGLCTFASEKNHYESRWILGVSVLTIPCFVVWCLVSIVAAVKVRDAAVAVGLLVNATMLLMCGPVRKLYLLNRYQATVEVVDNDYDSVLIASGKGGTDYNSMYGRHYDNAGRLHDRGSTMGSAHGSMHGSVRGDLQSSNGGMHSTYSSVRGDMRGDMRVIHSEMHSSGGNLGGIRVIGSENTGGRQGGSVGGVHIVRSNMHGGDLDAHGGSGGGMIISQGGVQGEGRGGTVIMGPRQEVRVVQGDAPSGHQSGGFMMTSYSAEGPADYSYEYQTPDPFEDY